MRTLLDQPDGDADAATSAWTSIDTNEDLLLVKSLLLSDDEVRASTPEWLSRHGAYAGDYRKFGVSGP